MKILVYNPDTNKMETYYRNLNDPMPYSKDKYLSVKEFRGSSKSDVLWTDKRAIEAFNKLRQIAIDNNLFTYVEPANLTPTWAHMDKRYKNPACPTGGYPLVRFGDKGVYVAVLQDALNTLGYNAGNIDGIFGNNTKNAVLRYQRANNLSTDGIVGCNTWRSITEKIKNSRR